MNLPEMRKRYIMINTELFSQKYFIKMCQPILEEYNNCFKLYPTKHNALEKTYYTDDDITYNMTTCPIYNHNLSKTKNYIVTYEIDRYHEQAVEIYNKLIDIYKKLGNTKLFVIHSG